MSIKDNLEKAAAIFGATSEPNCALMTEDIKDKMINDSFDITKHEFAGDIFFDNLDEDEMTLITSSGAYVDLTIYDAIAIAKALGVTGEDLK